MDSNYLGRQFRTLAGLCGAVVIFISILVCIGWQFDIAIFKTIVPGYISMKINTALGLFLFSAALLLLSFGREDRRIKASSRLWLSWPF